MRFARALLSLASTTQSIRSRFWVASSWPHAFFAGGMSPSALNMSKGRIEKQHGRRFPETSMSQARSTRFLRVSACLTLLSHAIQSLRAIGVRSFQTAFDFGAALSALRKSAGTNGSGASAVLGFGRVAIAYF